MQISFYLFFVENFVFCKLVHVCDCFCVIQVCLKRATDEKDWFLNRYDKLNESFIYLLHLMQTSVTKIHK